MVKNKTSLAFTLLENIDKLIFYRIKNIKCNYYKEGKIQTDNGNGTYDVLINEDTFTLKARAGLTLAVGDIVYVMIPNGNESFKFIDMKRP